MHATQRVHGHCLHCRSNCATVSVVQNGRLVAVEPDREHPNGGICVVGRSAPQLVYHPDRLQQPLRRTRPKTDPDPGWVPITWEAALAETAERLREIRTRDGAQAVAFARGTPSATGAADYFDWVDRLCFAFGSPNILGNSHLCQWARDSGSAYTYGSGLPSPDLEHAELIVLLGHNPAVSWQNNWRRIQAARQRGARLLVVDPRRSESAAQADLHLPIRPGTDGALILGWMRELINKQAYAADFLRDWTNGPFLVVAATGRFLRGEDAGGPHGHFGAVDGAGRLIWLDPRHHPAEQNQPSLEGSLTLPGGLAAETAFSLLRRRVEPYCPDRVAAITGVSQEALARSVAWWAQYRPVSYFTWNGLEQQTNSMQTNRALCTLYALTGCLEDRGGNMNPGRPPRPWVRGEALCPTGQANLRLGLDAYPLGAASFEGQPYNAYEAILTGRPYPIRALVAFGSNLVVQQMDPHRARAALAALEFHVHAELFPTPTADLADILLPAASPWESSALRLGYKGGGEMAERRVQWRPAVVAPIGGSRPDLEILFDLAARLGLDDPLLTGGLEAAWRHLLSETGLDLDAVRSASRGVELPMVAQPRRYNRVEQQTGFVSGFRTPTRRVELYSETLATHGYPPLPVYFPPIVGDGEHLGKWADQFPLVLTSIRSRYYSNSQGRAQANLRRSYPDPCLRIHPATAAALGITEGAMLQVSSPAGSVELRARLSDDVPPGLVATEPGWWQGSAEPLRPAVPAHLPASANLGLLVSNAWRDPESGSVSGKAVPCRVSLKEGSSHG